MLFAFTTSSLSDLISLLLLIPYVVTEFSSYMRLCQSLEREVVIWPCLRNFSSHPLVGGKDAIASSDITKAPFVSQ